MPHDISRFRDMCNAAVETIEHTLEQLSSGVLNAGELLCSSLEQGNKILICGNGGSAAEAMHLSSELVNRFEMDRPGLAAISLATDASTLTSIANDFAFEKVFARQVQALGVENDVLIAFTTSGKSANICRAIETAHSCDMHVMLFSGNDGGRAGELLKENDIELRIPSKHTARIQEVHLLLIHALCDYIDHSLFV